MIMTAHYISLSMMQHNAFLGTRIQSTKKSASDLTMNMRHYNDKRHAEGVGTNNGAYAAQ